MGGMIMQTTFPWRLQGTADDFRLLIQRPRATGVFSGDFDHGKSRADPLSSLQRTFAGSLVPLEVFSVNNSTLSPHQLCEYLQRFNPGELSCTKEVPYNPAKHIQEEAVNGQPAARQNCQCKLSCAHNEACMGLHKSVKVLCHALQLVDV